MPVVTNTIKRPDGTAYTAGRVVIELAGESGRPLSGGYVTTGDYTIESAFTIESLTAGVWSQTLVANTLISPSGTRWRITEQVDGRSHAYYVLVPDGAGPYFVEDILDEAPGALTPAPLTAHLDDTADAHDASAISYAGSTNLAATTVEAALDELDGEKAALQTRLWLAPAVFTAISAASLSYLAPADGNHRTPAWLFDAAAYENVTTTLWVPNGWATVDIDLYWSNGGAGSGDVIWLAWYTQAGDGESLEAATFASNATATAPAQHTVKVTSLATAVALNATEPVRLTVGRRGPEAGDTLANDAALIGIAIKRAS